MYGLNFEWRIFMKFLVLISKKRYTVTYKSWPEKLQISVKEGEIID